ncbi:vasorin b [Chanos chanos]|uniref:Vasorin b n=1 Tax=Chanos chanos TaxID=29144 RepID=A0A6J2WNL9_CHACN|nr:vasorin-like [Chanos chanos]
MKPFLSLLSPLLLLLLSLLLPSWTLASDCPKDCTCSSPNSIFCLMRRSSQMPPAVPTSTRNLYLFQNGIETLSQEDFEGLQNLEMLDLSQNKLSELTDHVFEPLSSLRNLDLSSNQITHIYKDSFAGLELLQRLYLYSNQIESIHPAAFDELTELLELKLQGNKLTMLPALKMPSLLLLDLRYNNIPLPDPADLQTPNLESLKLGGLGLSGLDDKLIGSLVNLQELDISNNQLKEFPHVLRELRGLVILSLAGNPMGPLKWEDFENLRELQELDISNLSLQGLPEDFPQRFPHLQRLTVAENPFNCLCTLAWFPGWLRNQKINLARTEETRCHFPPLNAGKVLERLEHRDFGCPTTTVTTSTVKTTVPTLITRLTSTTQAIVPPKPSDDPSTGTDSYPLPPAPATPTTNVDCPSSICLNGGTCFLDQKGHVECICPRGTSGVYCETKEPTTISTTVITVEPDISSRHVTSSSILIDLHRYIDSRPHIRGIRLTYRNLSGLDKRPLQLSVPATYPEYTLRGLKSNSTYSICASPMGEPNSKDSVCIEAHTDTQQRSTMVAQVEDQKLTTMIIPALAILLLLVLMAVAVGVVCYVHKRRANGQLDFECDPSQLEQEDVKAGLDNGALPQKQPELISSPPTAQKGGLDYEVPLMQQEHSTANNNMTAKKPSYF